jgi:hypothetical protein
LTLIVVGIELVPDIRISPKDQSQEKEVTKDKDAHREQQVHPNMVQIPTKGKQEDRKDVVPGEDPPMGSRVKAACIVYIVPF